MHPVASSEPTVPSATSEVELQDFLDRTLRSLLKLPKLSLRRTLPEGSPHSEGFKGRMWD